MRARIRLLCELITGVSPVSFVNDGVTLRNDVNFALGPIVLKSQ
jgi:hypothetical protein